MSLFGSFLNYFGWGGEAYADQVNSSIDRANIQFLLPPDSRFYIGRRTRKELNNKAEWLHQNFGVVKDGSHGIARHVVGKGISLAIDSEDPEFNAAGEQDFEDYALTPDRIDRTGRRNLYEMQDTAVVHRMLRGEFFAVHAENPRWENAPCYQLYDSEEIGTPLDYIQPTQNLILDGVQLDPETTAATHYHVLKKDGSGTVPIPAAQMVHWYKPHAINQSRGITEFAQAVNPLVDIYELRRLTTRSAKAQQLIALVLKGVVKSRGRGALGAIKNAAPGQAGATTADASQLEALGEAAGAGIAYLAGDQYSDAKLLTPNSPTPLVEQFINFIMRDVMRGWGVHSEFFWNISDMSGANTRFILAAADLFFQIMADRLIDRFCRPIAFRYLSHRIETGKLVRPKDPLWFQKLTWQTPARVTVDNGRDGKLLIELLANGMITLREYCNQRGLNYRSEMRQWIREPLEFLRIAKEECEKAGIDDETKIIVLDRWKQNLPIWRAAKPGAIQAPGADPNGDDDDEEMKKAA